MKLGFIGAGQMANEHARAFKALGNEIVAVSATPTSNNIEMFSRKYNVKKQYSSHINLFENEKIDALIVTTPPHVTADILGSIRDLTIPALIEKPGSNRSSVIKNELLKKESIIYFGYNRRFYESVSQLKVQSDKHKGHFVFNLVQPTFEEISERDYVFVNEAVHMLDMIRFLIPGSEIEAIFYDSQNKTYYFKILQFTKPAGTLRVSFGPVRNQSIEWDKAGLSATLKPIEVLTLSNMFTILEPTPEFPSRRYIPSLINFDVPEKTLSSTEFKPGIMTQAKEFQRLVVSNGQSRKTRLASPGDAYYALKWAEQICDSI